MFFPSTDSGGNPFEPLFNRSYFLSDQNPSSEQALNPPFLSSSSSPFFDEGKLPLNQMLSQNQLVARKNLDTSDQIKNNHVGVATKSNKKEIDWKAGVGPLTRRNLGVLPRRKPGKKDRHSKICTAHGIRDRRMRLSLQVARKFFDLQDMLGFDKASKTIEWLFTNSKKAIKELKQTFSDQKISESFLSDCEVTSDIEDSSRNDARQSSTPADATALCIKESETKFDQENACKSNTRESRDKARARARSRTREKMMIKWVEDLGPGHKPNPGDYYLETLGFPNSPFGGVDDGPSSQKRVSPYEHVYHPIEHQLPDVDTIEKLLGNSSSSVSSSWTISNYNSSDAAASGLYIDPNFSFLGFLGNWDQVSVQGNNPNSIYPSTPDFQ